MRPCKRPLLIAISLTTALLILSVSGPATAKAEHMSPYSFKQSFGTVLRLLKVDLSMQVTENNAEWGFLLFEYLSVESGERKNRGSFQFVRIKNMVRISLQLPQMPSYHEQLIIKKLKRKLEQDHGAPPPPLKKKSSNDTPPPKQAPSKRAPAKRPPGNAPAS